MAERRMFAKSIIDSDAFLDMPLSTQALYFHLSMRADDDGFINNPKKIARMLGSGEDEVKVLLAKKFILSFDSGVIVIKHWKIHNYIQKDRYKSTNYHDEMAQLTLNENNGYSLDTSLDTQSVQDGSTGKDRKELGKERKGEVNKSIVGFGDDGESFSSLSAEVIAYLNERAGTRYNPKVRKNIELITARAKEGFALDDFKEVIDKKVMLWGNDPKMQAYIRPSTLFGTKFEAYLNEIVTTARALAVTGAISQKTAQGLGVMQEFMGSEQ